VQVLLSASRVKFISSRNGLRTVAVTVASVQASAYANADPDGGSADSGLTADPILLQASAHITVVTRTTGAFLVSRPGVILMCFVLVHFLIFFKNTVCLEVSFTLPTRTSNSPAFSSEFEAGLVSNQFLVCGVTGQFLADQSFDNATEYRIFNSRENYLRCIICR